jgi:hypothetical protein
MREVEKADVVELFMNAVMILLRERGVGIPVVKVDSSSVAG